MALPKKGYKPGIYRFVSGTVDGNGDFSITNIPKDGYVSGIYQLTEVTIDADGNTSVAEDDIGITAAIEVTVDGSGDLSVTEVPEEGYVSGVYRVTTSTNIPKEGFNQIDFSAVIGTISGGKWETGPGIQFNAPLTFSLIPSPAVAATYTFARGDTDATVTDFEGLVKDVTATAARFVGARSVENLVVASNDLTDATWIDGGTASKVDNLDGTYTWNLPNVNDSVRAVGLLFNPKDRDFAGTIEAKGSGTVKLQVVSNGVRIVATTTITLTSEFRRYTVTAVFNATDTGSLTYRVRRESGDTATSVIVRLAQVEEITGQTKQDPSEHVSTDIGEDHGSGVVNVKNFNTENGNTVVGNVVTESTGSAIPAATLEGVLVEGQRTNYADTDDDLTGGAETINITAGGTGDYTLSVYGSAAVTVAAGTATGSGFAQATEGNPVTFNITVVGTITLTLDSGTLDTSQEGGYLKQVEVGSFATTFIPSPTTVAATRNAESLSYPNTNILDDAGTLAITFTPDGDTADYTGGGDRAIIGVRGVNADLLHIDTTTGKLILSDGTNETVPTTLPALVAGTATKIAIRWSATTGTMQIRQDAVEVSATFDGSMNKSTAMRVGYSGANRANGTYKNLIVYNGAVNDATFTGLTA